MSKLKSRTINFISDDAFDVLVEDTYGKPYSFQQQDGCKERGVYHYTIPIQSQSDYKNDTITEDVNSNEMGVSFNAWLERSPNALIMCQYLKEKDKDTTELWWHRNFYPNVEMIIDDLYKKGLLEEGEYVINIDW